jgi:hypothetical protein
VSPTDSGFDLKWGFLLSERAVQTMQTLRVPGRKNRPRFAPDVPPQVRRLIWIKWLQQQAASERPFFPLSSVACAELASLLNE